MIDTPADLTAVAEQIENPVEELMTAEGVDERPCEICKDPVGVDERWEILRNSGPVWRHYWHTEDPNFIPA